MRLGDAVVRLHTDTEDEPSARACTVMDLAMRKVTVALDERHLDTIRALVGAGSARSVSGFVQQAVEASLDDIDGWGAVIADALREPGGLLSDDERQGADGILE
jgi:Arc/MetJ-type ribon-helix-helix transcriptional regulator